MTAPWSPGWRPPRASADRYPALALQAPYGREGLCSLHFYTAPLPHRSLCLSASGVFCACRCGMKRGTPAVHAKHAPLRKMPVFLRRLLFFAAGCHQGAEPANLFWPTLCATGIRTRRGRPPRATCLKNIVKEVFNEHPHAKGKRPGAHAAHQRTTAGT